MARRLDGSLARRLLAAQLTIDESTAMSAAQTDPAPQRLAFWITGVSVYVFWNLGTLLGASAGTAIDPKTLRARRGVPRRVSVATVWPLPRDRRARLARGTAARSICPC